MKIYIKVVVVFFALFFGTIILLNQLSIPDKKDDFSLIDYVQENEVAYHTSAIQVINQLLDLNAQTEKNLTQKIALNQLKNELLEAGLRLEHTYFTYSREKSGRGSVYIEITDTTQFNAAFKKLSTYFNLQNIQSTDELYMAPNHRISVKKHPKYLQLNFGFMTKKELLEEEIHSSSLFQDLLKKPNSGVINTAETEHLDSTNYATFSYSFDNSFKLDINWKTMNSPWQKNTTQPVLLYPTPQNKLRIFSNLDLQYFKNNASPFLLKEWNRMMDQIPAEVKEILDLWNGIASLQLGGKTAQKSTQYVTEFDEDFNPIEKEIVKVDSILDLGLYWGTNHPKKTLNQLKTLTNVELKDEELQIALLPALKVQTNNDNLKISSLLNGFKKIDFKELLSVSTNIPGLDGKISVKKSNEQTVHIELQIKDWRLFSSDRKLQLSMFW